MPSLARWASLAAFVFLAGCATSARPSLILHGARVYTLAWGDPDAEGRPAPDAPFADGQWSPDATAVVVESDRIAFVGSDAEALAMRGRGTRVVGLDGATVVPGLIESHGHLHEIGEKAEEISLVDVCTEADIADRLRAAATDRPDGEWILGTGWDEGAWADALPDRAFLDALFPDRPVVLKGLRGFGTFGNARALEAAGLGPDTEDPVGGTLVRRADGSLTGVLLNNATDLLNDAVPLRSMAHRQRILRHGMDQLLQAGYVSTHHAGVRTDYLPVYQALADSLPMRVEVLLAVGVPDAPDVDEWTRRGPTTDREAMLQIRAVKAYYDGSLGSRGARLLDDYVDQPGHRGVAGADYGFDADATEAYIAAGFQAGIHAIGDAGNRDVLDFYEGALSRHPDARALRHRVEHAQVVHPDDLDRFGTLGLVASMEPGHAVEDSPWAEERLGPDRVRGAYAWRSLRRGGALLLFNADFTGTDWSVFYGLYAATTRRQKDGTPPGGWYLEQAVTAEEALRAYTVWPARASGIEDRTGTLDVGKWADLTVLSLDPFTTPADDLLSGSVLMTVVDGVVRFEAEDR